MWSKTLLKILRELNYPPLFLAPKEHFESLEWELEDAFGGYGDTYPIYTLKKGLRGRVLANVIYHEIGHRLFPYRPEWWIECYAQKMARGGGTGDYTKLHGHSAQELPNRERLLKLSLRANERLKQNVKKKQKTIRKKSR